MKDKFYEYIDPKTDEIKGIWKDGIISVDANILLNFYRYTEKTREEFFTALEKCKDQLWLTHQAGEEFFTNRRNLFRVLKLSYKDWNNKIESKIDELKSQISKTNHPLIEANALNEILDRCLSDVEKYLLDLEVKHPNYADIDPVLDRITSLFDKKIGESFVKERLIKVYDEGASRYKDKIPPGYCDRKSKKEDDATNCYGDLVLWYQLIEKSKNDGKPLVFVTDDNKEDWWEKENGISISPRKELIREFHDKTGMRILIYNAMCFLKYLEELHNSSIEENTINEVEKISSEQRSTPQSFASNCNQDFLNAHCSDIYSNGIHINEPVISLRDDINKITSSLSAINAIDTISSLKTKPDSASLYALNTDPLSMIYIERPWEQNIYTQNEKNRITLESAKRK